ncbi:hypothetical protein ACA910_002113 [Epithemia clementina (nom. ined.)]
MALEGGGLAWKDLSVVATGRSTLAAGRIDTGNDGNEGRPFTNGTSTTFTTTTTTLVHPCFGFVPNGQICAILGPSGSGKTTFLSALAGRSPHMIHGQVTYYNSPNHDLAQKSDKADGSSFSFSANHGSNDDNKKETDVDDNKDKDVDDDCAFFVSDNDHDNNISQQSSPDPSQVAWLSQVDHFFSMLTPRETLLLAAYLELPHWKEKDRQALVQRQLISLGLLNVADNCVGSSTDATISPASSIMFLHPSSHRLSGGERRRLSVALELLTQDILYVLADEPTSGLDASLAVTVLQLIRRQAQERGIPTLASLHQPRSSVWHTYIDYVMLLAPGGHVCYCGPKDECLPYFANLGFPCPTLTNPAEFLVDLVSIPNAEEEIDGETRTTPTNDDDYYDATKTVQQTHVERIEFLARAFADYQKKQQPPKQQPTQEQLQGRNRTEDRDASLGKREYGGSPSLSVPRQGQRRPGPLPSAGRTTSLGLFRPVASLFRGVQRSTRRLGALWRRSWRQSIRDRPLHVFRFLASVGNAIILAKVFPSVVKGSPPLPSSVADRVALLSFGAVNMAFMAFMKAVTVFAEERPVVHREQTRRQYSALEYLLAKSLAELPLDALFTTFFTTTLKWVSGLQISWSHVTGTFSLLAVASASLGYMIGSWTPPSGQLATTASIPVVVVLMVVGIINPSGVDPNHPPPALVQALANMSPFRYAIEALCLGEYPGMEFYTGPSRTGLRGWLRKIKNLPRMGALALVQNGDQVIEALGLQHQTYKRAMIQLGWLSLGFLGLSWLGLEVRGWLAAPRPVKPTKKQSKKGRQQKQAKNMILEEKDPMVDQAAFHERSRNHSSLHVPVIRRI